MADASRTVASDEDSYSPARLPTVKCRTQPRFWGCFRAVMKWNTIALPRHGIYPLTIEHTSLALSLLCRRHATGGDARHRERECRRYCREMLMYISLRELILHLLRPLSQ